MLKKISAPLLVVLTSCISGPKDPGQGTLEKLNGDSYESQNSVMLIPVTRRKPVRRTIFGRVICGDGLSQWPANGAKVQLIKDKTLVVEVETSPDGAYRLLPDVELGTQYKLIATSSCGKYFGDFLPAPEESKAVIERDLFLKK